MWAHGRELLSVCGCHAQQPNAAQTKTAIGIEYNKTKEHFVDVSQTRFNMKSAYLARALSLKHGLARLVHWPDAAQNFVAKWDLHAAAARRASLAAAVVAM